MSQKMDIHKELHPFNIVFNKHNKTTTNKPKQMRSLTRSVKGESHANTAILKYLS